MTENIRPLREAVRTSMQRSDRSSIARSRWTWPSASPTRSDASCASIGARLDGAATAGAFASQYRLHLRLLRHRRRPCRPSRERFRRPRFRPPAPPPSHGRPAHHARHICDRHRPPRARVRSAARISARRDRTSRPKQRRRFAASTTHKRSVLWDALTRRGGAPLARRHSRDRAARDVSPAREPRGRRSRLRQPPVHRAARRSFRHAKSNGELRWTDRGRGSGHPSSRRARSETSFLRSRDGTRARTAGARTVAHRGSHRHRSGRRAV